MYCGIPAELPAGADILPPSNDRIFKLLLTHPDAEKVLIDIVSTVINRKVVAVQIRNIELPVMDVNEKDERLDINCTIDSGDQVDVEMHSCPQEEIGKEFFNFVNELVRTYQITFCMHTVLPDWPNFVNRFSLRNASGRLLSDQINMIIIELDKLDALLKKPVNKLTAFEKWSLFFKFAQDSIQRGKINDIIKEKEEIGMAAALLQQISRDEREKAIFRSRRMAETDRVSDLLTAEERGKIHEREKWQNVVAEKEAELADQKTMLAGQKTIIENLNMQIAELQAKVQNKSFS